MAEVVKDYRLLFQQSITLPDLRRLAHILRTGRLSDDKRDLEFLYENSVAAYSNDNAWFRPHEILVRWVEAEATRLAGQHIEPAS